jgi:hypothetical protein
MAPGRLRAAGRSRSRQAWEPLTTGMGQPIVTCVEMNALRAGLDENHSRARPRLCPPTWNAMALLLLGKALAIAAISCLGACKQPLVVGEYKCPVSSPEAGSPPSKFDPIPVPWSSGFEDQFCDYPGSEEPGWCYGFPPASFRIVSSPVHSGQFAAEFTILTGTDAGAQPQARCSRQGVLPAEAYYGAWYFIPELVTLATDKDYWNLFHFQGGNSDATSIHYLWDVSLVNGTSGDLNLRVFDNLDSNKHPTSTKSVPIGKWFQIVFYWKRAKDTSGAVALYQDGEQVVDLAGLVTDDTDWGQWYVGNLATTLQPPRSTVYVDDVTIRSTL